MIKRSALAALLGILLCGCLSFQRDYRVTVSLRDGWKQLPIPDAEVIVARTVADLDSENGERLTGRTDGDGRIDFVIPAAWARTRGVPIRAAGKSCTASPKDLREGITRMAAPWGADAGLVLVRVEPGNRAELSASEAKADSDEAETLAWEEEQVRWFDAKLSQEPVTGKDLSADLAQWLVDSVDLTGEWASCDWHDGITLLITAKHGAGYGLTYHCQSWRGIHLPVKREAKVNAGVLLLSAPVRGETMADAYNRFYVVRVAGRIRLLSQATAERWLEKGADPESFYVQQSMLVKIVVKDGRVVRSE